MGIAPSLITQWVSGVRRIPADRVLPLASATSWQVTPHDLRPDIYPNPADAIPTRMTKYGVE